MHLCHQLFQGKQVLLTVIALIDAIHGIVLLGVGWFTLRITIASLSRRIVLHRGLRWSPMARHHLWSGRGILEHLLTARCIVIRGGYVSRLLIWLLVGWDCGLVLHSRLNWMSLILLLMLLLLLLMLLVAATGLFKSFVWMYTAA